MNRLVRDKNLKESAIHRSGKLPLKIYADDYVRYHWHDEYEFLLSEGDGVRCTVSGVQIELKTGCALLIQAGDLHAISSAGPQEITEIVVHPSFWADGEDSELFAGKLRFQSHFSAEDSVDSQIIERLFAIKELYRARTFGYEFQLKALFCEIFSIMLGHGRYRIETQNDAKETEASKNLFAYVHQHYAEDLSLEHLAQVSHYSKSYVIKLFKKNTGQTPVEYINRYRLDRAKALLKEPNHSVLDIALGCGFQNVGYFIRVFKDRFGVTPGVFRRELLKEISGN